jgi:hypothetical protein
MNRTKNNRKNKTRGQRGRGAPLMKFANPRFGQLDEYSTYETLPAEVQLFTTTGTNGFNVSVNWQAFQDGFNLSLQYRYFEVLGWRIDATIPSVSATTDSFFDGSVCFYPANYTIDGIPTVVPTDSRSVLRQQGAVNLKISEKNTGRWFAPTTKQVYSTDSFTRSNLAGSVLAYFDDVGTLEYPLSLIVSCNVKLYGQKYTSAQATSVLKAYPSQEGVRPTKEDEDEVISVRSTSKSKRK